MAKLVIVFEVPDPDAQAYAGQYIKNGSFDDKEMRPLAVFGLKDPLTAAAVRGARREVGQEHPWIPGGLFKAGNLKGLLLAFFDALTADPGDPDYRCPGCGQELTSHGFHPATGQTRCS